MEWDRETKLKLARKIRKLSLEIQEDEFGGSRCGFVKLVENTMKRIMNKLEPLGFEPANRDWAFVEEDEGGKLYQDSPTHLWFETAQGRIVKISKENAEKLLVLGIP